MRKIIIALLSGLALAVLPIAPALATGSHSNGCAAYNLCGTFPTGSHNCTEIGHEVAVGKWDPWGLDRDNDHKGCEQGDSNPPVHTSTSPSSKPHPSTSRSHTVAAGTPQGPQLAKTGPSAPLFAGAAAVLLALGGAALIAVRRRRVQFKA